MPNTKKSGKRMKFSQPVIGLSAKRKRKPSVGLISAPSAGTVIVPNKGVKRGKKVF